MASAPRIKSFDSSLLEIVTKFKVTPVPFVNGDIKNKAGENPKSAVIFAYGLKMELPAEDTLPLFGEHYEVVRKNPEGTDHPNIRQFMLTGWSGIKFPKGMGLKKRKVPLFSPPAEKPDKKKNKKK